MRLLPARENWQKLVKNEKAIGYLRWIGKNGKYNRLQFCDHRPNWLPVETEWVDIFTLPTFDRMFPFVCLDKNNIPLFQGDIFNKHFKIRRSKRIAGWLGQNLTTKDIEHLTVALVDDGSQLTMSYGGNKAKLGQDMELTE